MRNTESLIVETLKLFPEVIDIADVELRAKNCFFSQTLSDAVRKAESSNGILGNNIEFMIWAIYRLLHKKSRENFRNGIHKVLVEEIKIKDIESEYQKVLKEAE